MSGLKSGKQSMGLLARQSGYQIDDAKGDRKEEIQRPPVLEGAQVGVSGSCHYLNTNLGTGTMNDKMVKLSGVISLLKA